MKENVTLPSANASRERILQVQVDHRRWLSSQDTGGRTVEALLACNVLNRMTQLGQPKSFAIGR